MLGLAKDRPWLGRSLPGEGWGWEAHAWEAASSGGGEGVRGRVSHPVKR